MEQSSTLLSGHHIEIYSLNTVVVGSGASGFNAVDRLYDYGQRNIALLTEGIHMGTSRNTGSDKQTYYKLTLAGGGGDSIHSMAETLFAGKCMHGDLALCEAALSVPSFYKLVDIGVPFPHNRFGEYIGYKTDHDPRQRATSAGPLTSRYMTEKLEERVLSKNIRIFDGYKVIGIITDKGVCKGLLALNKSGLDDKDRMFALFNCTNVILATGGPAGLYSCSVYPESQTGSQGIAFEAGVRGRNLTEWQYGIASTRFRWNLSGSYQQVLPRYISTDRNGNDPREFLDEHYPDPQQMLDSIFLKGYQWPFDSRKVKNYGSSLIDILVYVETAIKGRRVFLDFRNNPSALRPDFGNLGKEAYVYLEKSGAFQLTPVQRLAHLNQPAIDLYNSHGIDLSSEMLEIAVCAQHNNGGLAVNCWWETNISHLFAVGEAAGTHGVYRPGGTALNAGQAGSMRAAMFIAKRYREKPAPEKDFLHLAKHIIETKIRLAGRFLANRQGHDVKDTRKEIGERMSAYAAHIRSREQIEEVKEKAAGQLEDMADKTAINHKEDLIAAFENYDLSIAQYVYASAMENYIFNKGGSRGSFLVCGTEGTTGIEGMEDTFLFVPENTDMESKVQECVYRDCSCAFEWTDVRPIPEDDAWFENVWKDYMNDRIVEG